jgi:hypothetical protein
LRLNGEPVWMAIPINTPRNLNIAQCWHSGSKWSNPDWFPLLHDRLESESRVASFRFAILRTFRRYFQCASAIQNNNLVYQFWMVSSKVKMFYLYPPPQSSTLSPAD